MNTNSILATFEKEIRADERKRVEAEFRAKVAGMFGVKRVRKSAVYKKTCKDCGIKVKGIGVHRAMKHEGKGRWNKKA